MEKSLVNIRFPSDFVCFFATSRFVPNFRLGMYHLGMLRLSILQNVVRRTFKVSDIASVEFIGCFLYPIDARSTQNPYTEKFQLTPDCMFSQFRNLKTFG